MDQPEAVGQMTMLRPHDAGLYRVCLVGVIIENYMILRHLLPLLRPDTVDATLYGIDLFIFGFEPALWFEKLNQRPVVEWFSFFYLSYFWINAAYLVAIAVIRRGGRETSEFAIGILITFRVGQLGYMAVPGFGPVGYLASSFHAPLDGGFFWSCVSRTVTAGSAMKDIFPSLHTAVPTFLTWFAWQRSRTEPGWRLVTLATGFFAANIIVSTMLLRWHFAIDVVVGLVLGSAAWSDWGEVIIDGYVEHAGCRNRGSVASKIDHLEAARQMTMRRPHDDGPFTRGAREC